MAGPTTARPHPEELPMHTHPATHTDGEYEMPSVEALLAGTLALMTGHAQSACARQRGLMSH